MAELPIQRQRQRLSAYNITRRSNNLRNSDESIKIYFWEKVRQNLRASLRIQGSHHIYCITR
ncbi:unknown protein [Microcystis aeruginosa NIES-843]|uniref:Uncharacterized protein n=1 Tax=Microcystis aeruginosa (strain NIES-843 / IAM M-2473) TaxID=449447 RepID=B0JUJ0_MICAN|nr:unknown protein [Microcystis aeruginosa NIES-843]